MLLAHQMIVYSLLSIPHDEECPANVADFHLFLLSRSQFGSLKLIVTSVNVRHAILENNTLLHSKRRDTSTEILDKNANQNYLIIMTIVIGFAQKLSFLLQLVAETHQSLRLFHVTLYTALFGLLHEFVDLLSQQGDLLFVLQCLSGRQSWLWK